MKYLMRGWKWRSLLLAVLLSCLLQVGCGDENTLASGSDQAISVDGAAGEETEEMLYRLALTEEPLVIYSISMRIFETKEAFEKTYPGLTVDVQILRAFDILEELMDEDGEAPGCDLIICSDTDVLLSSMLAPSGKLISYVPPGLEDAIPVEYREPLVYFMVESSQLLYNTELSSTPPVTNWWELTEERFRGQVVMVDPIRSFSNYALLCTMIQNHDEMCDAYYQLYGEVLQVPEGLTAGHVFWQRLFDNDLQFAATSDEVVDIIGTPGQQDLLLGITVSSKARKENLGYTIAPVYDVEPRTGMASPGSVMMTANADSVNSAKLFIWFLFGGKDGRGEGLQPYQTEGSWPVRTDVEPVAARPLSEMNYWSLDKEYFLTHGSEIQEFWLGIQEAKGQEASP